MVIRDTGLVRPGWYEAMITHSEKIAPGNCLRLKFEIVGGAYNGRVLYKPLQLDSSDAGVKEKALAELKAICRAVSVMKPQDCSDLHDIPLCIGVDMSEGRNFILAFERIRLPLSPPAEKVGIVGL